MTFDRARLAFAADALAAAAVVSLPWSTSATSILVPVWAAAALASDGAALRKMLWRPEAALAAALCALAVAGVAWSAEAAWPLRLAGIAPFLKLLVIPLLFVQFARSERGDALLAAYGLSAGVLLAASLVQAFTPQIHWRTPWLGVPVKDYLIQNAEFVLCGFVLLDRAFATWPGGRARALVLAGLALVFLGDVLFVALGRTSLIVMAVLFALLGLRHFTRRAFALFLATGVALAALAWTASPYLRYRVTHLAAEIDGSSATSAGSRLAFWRMSGTVIGTAPLLGHGTGSIRGEFAAAAAADPAAPADASNPHNQVLAIAIQFGLVGAVLVLAMWAAHLRMFLLPGATAWIGLCVTVQNVVSSLFNSHLSDFSNGWLYVFGVGIAGGAMLRPKRLAPAFARPMGDAASPGGPWREGDAAAAGAVAAPLGAPPL